MVWKNVQDKNKKMLLLTQQLRIKTFRNKIH